MVLELGREEEQQKTEYQKKNESSFMFSNEGRRDIAKKLQRE